MQVPARAACAGTQPLSRRKRPNGEGSIDRVRHAGWMVLPDGQRVWRGALWRGRITVQGRRRAVYGATRAVVVAKLDGLRYRSAAGQLFVASPSDGSLRAYLEDWLETKRSTVRLRTYERYRQLVRKHVIPALGDRQLVALRPDELQRLYQEKAGAGLSPRTVHHIHTALRTALEQATLWGYTARNVGRLVRPPTVPPRESRWPTADEVGHLVGAAAVVDDRLQALWALAVHTGCRLGELLGLGWEDVDLEERVLHVRRVLVRVRDRQPLFGEPKTRRSRRAIHLTSDAVVALRGHRARQQAEQLGCGAASSDAGLVFTTRAATPLSVSVVRSSFKRALARAGLPSATRFHDLRHTCATLLLSNGVDIPTVSAILGHARTSTTVDIYWHALPARLSVATDVIQLALPEARGCVAA